MDKAPKEFQAIIPAGDDSPELVKPSEEVLDFPAAPAPAKRASILGGQIARVFDHPVRSDRLHASVPLQAQVELVTVEGFVSN